MVAVELVLFVALTLAVLGTPAFVIAHRRGLAHPWVAFIPLVGLWIVLAEASGHSGWFGVAALLPVVSFILIIWFAFELPPHHRRSRWWTLALIVPGPNLIGYWVYAFTLPRSSTKIALAAG